MTRRAVRRLAQRRYAVLGAIAEHDGATAGTVAAALHKNFSETVFDLQMLERQGRIVSELAARMDGSPPRRLYRLPKAWERAQQQHGGHHV